jgi:hypothetical protein
MTGSGWGGLVAFVVLGLVRALAGNPPSIELDAPRCARVTTRPRVCARIVDDGTIARARLLFRAEGEQAFYWTEMQFEGSRFCAWLPQPSKKTRAIDVYVEAVDDTYEVSRTPERTLWLEAACPLAPEGEPPAEKPCVGTTLARQRPKPKGFEDDSLTTGC